LEAFAAYNKSNIESRPIAWAGKAAEQGCWRRLKKKETEETHGGDDDRGGSGDGNSGANGNNGGDCCCLEHKLIPDREELISTWIPKLIRATTRFAASPSTTDTGSHSAVDSTPNVVAAVGGGPTAVRTSSLARVSEGGLVTINMDDHHHQNHHSVDADDAAAVDDDDAAADDDDGTTSTTKSKATQDKDESKKEGGKVSEEEEEEEEEEELKFGLALAALLRDGVVVLGGALPKEACDAALQQLKPYSYSSSSSSSFEHAHTAGCALSRSKACWDFAAHPTVRRMGWWLMW
jgi:hypothetical protein